MNLAMFTPYDLIACEETLENNINAELLNYQHGEEFISASLGARHIEITGRFGTVTQRREMKHEMERVFNPTLQGTLKYYNASNRKTRTIEAMPEALPDISFQENGVYFTINLVCHFPFWQGQSITEHISTINKLGTFPLIIPEDEGFVFGYRADTLQTTFENKGDSEAGATYILTAEGGTVVNPYITHLESGRTTRLKYTMQDGDVIKVINMPNFASIRLNDADGMSYLEFNPDGNFFMLDFGDNTIAYRADENATNLSVSVHYDPLYLGVD